MLRNNVLLPCITYHALWYTTFTQSIIYYVMSRYFTLFVRIGSVLENSIVRLLRGLRIHCFVMMHIVHAYTRKGTNMHLYSASIKPLPARTARRYIHNRKVHPFYVYFLRYGITLQPWGMWYHVIPTLVLSLW